MAIEKPAPWTGASGSEYTFFVFGLAPDVPSRLGNFIYAKRNAEGAWVPLYMGQGDLAACCTDPGVLRCIARKSATHLHLRLNSREADRDAELQDLLAHYANAFAPEGCHPARAAHATVASGETSADGRAASKPARAVRVAAKNAPENAAAKPGAKAATAGKAAPARAAPRKAAARKAAVGKTPLKPRPRAK